MTSYMHNRQLLRSGLLAQGRGMAFAKVMLGIAKFTPARAGVDATK